MSVAPGAEVPPMDGSDEFLFDDDELEQLLEGDHDLVPAGLRPLVPVIAAARRPATAAEAAAEDEMTALFRHERGPRAVRPRRSFGVKVVAVAGVLTIASATAAAAGGLPEPVQNTASLLLARVGISVPTGDSGPDAGPGAGVPDTSVPAPSRTDVAVVAEIDPASGAAAEVAPDGGEAPVMASADVAGDPGLPVDPAEPTTGAPAGPMAATPKPKPEPAPDTAEAAPTTADHGDEAAPEGRGTSHPDTATPPGQDKQKPAPPPRPPKSDKPGKPEKP